MVFKAIHIRSFERGLRFIRGEFVSLEDAGRTRLWIFRPWTRIDVVDIRQVWLRHDHLDVIARSGALDGQAEVIDLADHEWAIVRVDGRFDRVLTRGLHVAWSLWKRVEVERRP